MPLGFSKEQQLAHHIKRKASKLSNKDRGNELEKEVAKAFNGKRNHQGGTGGGISRADVSAMRDWHFESKNTERLEIPAWLRNLKAETPPEKKYGLVFICDGEPWVAIKLGERANFAADLIEAAGGEVHFP